MTDILVYNGDLGTVDGDFAIGESGAQHVHHIIAAHKGDYKQSPFTGVGRKRFLNGSLDGETRRDVQVQLEADGFRLSGFAVDEKGNLEITFA